MTMDESLQTLRRKIALGTRILASQGCLGDILGHLSARIPGTDEMFMRLLGDEEKGLLYSDVRHVRRLGFERTVEQVDGYRVPLELPIHGELYKARPEAQVVLHAHPYHCLIATIAGIELKPIYGSYDPLSLSRAIQGIPLYPRSVLIDTPELAAEFIAVMGDRDCCLMRGHGLTVIGPTVEAVTLLALRLEMLAKITLDAARATGGRAPEPLPQADLDAFAFVVEQGLQAAVSKVYEWTWNHYAQRVADTVGLPAEE
jgi:ribulose-5-phosphate 4-epimerase/fuculose-1-phosphate aldolase